jgi:hypothetical protein
MRAGAGPSVIFSQLNHSRPDWIQFDIADGRPEVRLIEHRREVSALPQMTSPLVCAIDALGVTQMKAPQCQMQ